MDDKKKSLTVFDCDDVLLNLNEAVYPFLGLSNPTSFKYRISGQYTQSQVDDITRLYGDPETFRRAEFAKGADKILDLENYGTDVRICTRSFNEEVEAVKRVILPEHTHVSLDHIEFQIGLGHEKLLPDKADIMVEDCLDNLLKLPQPVIRILINKSHNQESSAFDFYNRIYRFKDLVDALEFIKHILSSGLIYNYSWRRADFMSHPIPGIPFERYKQCQ